MKVIEYKPIGIIHSPYTDSKGTPIQPRGAGDTEGTVELFPEYSEGLKDLEDFSHAFLLYHFHLSRKAGLLQKPFMDEQERGVFAMRSPSRPNPIGLSVVRIVGIKDNVIMVQGVDILDGTPLLDIKPYVPEFDVFKADKTGWLRKNIRKLARARDDGRFSK